MAVVIQDVIEEKSEFPSEAPPPPNRLWFSVEDFHRLVKLGFFMEDDRIELVEGYIVEMAPIGKIHAGLQTQLTQALILAAQGRILVSPQNPLRLAPNTEVYPDLALLKPREDFYKFVIPTAEDVILIVEIPDTTLGYDRNVKVPLYAKHGVAEVWIFDVEHDQVEIFREPSVDGYRLIMRPDKTATIAPAGFPDARIDLAEIWR